MIELVSMLVFVLVCVLVGVWMFCIAVCTDVYNHECIGVCVPTYIYTMICVFNCQLVWCVCTDLWIGVQWCVLLSMGVWWACSNQLKSWKWMVSNRYDSFEDFLVFYLFYTLRWCAMMCADVNWCVMIMFLHWCLHWFLNWCVCVHRCVDF